MTNASTATVAALCRRTHCELVAFGEPARPLVLALDLIADAAGERSLDALGDPRLVLKLARACAASGPLSASVAGAVLDDLLRQAGVVGVASTVCSVADACDRYATEGFVLRAAGTRRSYLTWVRRLVDAHGSADIATVTSAQLGAVIAGHTRWGGRPGCQDGRGAEEMAVAAYRHLWTWLLAEASSYATWRPLCTNRGGVRRCADPSAPTRPPSFGACAGWGVIRCWTRPPSA